MKENIPGICAGELVRLETKQSISDDQARLRRALNRKQKELLPWLTPDSTSEES